MGKKRTRAKITRELPQIGTPLNAKYLKTNYKAKIVKDKKALGGRAIKYDGNLYSTMSGAAKAITKRPVNGWVFWKY